jgi:hypothetical protein
LWRTVVDEAVALIVADGAAVVTYTERFWQTLAARPSDAAPNDSAVAAVIETLFRQGRLQQPISIDDPAEGASWEDVGGRGHLLYVVRNDNLVAVVRLDSQLTSSVVLGDITGELDTPSTGTVAAGRLWVVNPRFTRLRHPARCTGSPNCHSVPKRLSITSPAAGRRSAALTRCS